MLAEGTLSLLTSSATFSDVIKTATVMNKRMQPLLNLHFHFENHKGKSYRKALSAIFKHIGKTGVSRILFLYHCLSLQRKLQLKSVGSVLPACTQLPGVWQYSLPASALMNM